MMEVKILHWLLRIKWDQIFPERNLGFVMGSEPYQFFDQQINCQTKYDSIRNRQISPEELKA